MKVLYDVHNTGRRYMSVADMQQEISFLGLDPLCTPLELANEIHRRGLDDFSPGRAVKGAQA
jgi:hypothetical protein